MAPIRILAGTVLSMWVQLLFAALVVAFVVFFGQRFGFFGDSIRLAPTSAANVDAGNPREVELFTLLPKDAILSIDEPQFIRAGEAEWSSSTQVIGIEVEGDARAYPLPVLAAREIVNDVVGGRPVAVTYCPLCLTGLVFDRTLDGQVVEFGVSGKLLMNVLVMYDRETGSLWSQILREGLTGPNKGRTLTVVDSLQTTWATWKRLHPDTLILDVDPRNDGYASYYRNADAGVLGDFVQDDRLPTKVVVVGIVVGRTPRAYPLPEAGHGGVVNDVIERTPVAVVFGDDGVTGVVYHRRLGDQLLTFDPLAGDPDSIVDRETETVWDALTGRALTGPVAGAVLQRLTATNSFWFGWRDFYPHTTVFGLDQPPPGPAS